MRGACRAPDRSRSIANRIAFPVVVVLFGLVAYVAYSQSELRRWSGVIDSEIASYRSARWERPPLREIGQDGNAAGDVWEALRSFGGLRDRERDSLALSLYYGEVLSPVQHALIAEEAPSLARLRESGRRTWSRTELAVESGLAVDVPRYPRVVDAALLLLASGVAQGPDACLDLAADVVRIGQDLVPGAPLEAVSVAARLATLATRVGLRCAASAERSVLARAVREFRTLAKAPPPIGHALALTDLLTLVELRARTELFSPRLHESAWARLWARPEAFEAIQRLGRPSRWRALASSDYPATLDAWRNEQQWRARSRLPLVSSESAGVLGFVYDDMRGQAVVRAAAIALATLLERQRLGKIPPRPDGIDEGALRDPFTGRQLRWRVAHDGTELTVWSVGEDLRDDKGIDDWTTEAPLDVAVHVAFRPLEELAPEPRAHRNRRTR